MVTDQLRVEFRNELRQAIASCMELTRTAIQGGTTQPGSPHPPASPSIQNELCQAQGSCVKPDLQDGTTQTDDPSSPAVNLSGELTPMFYSPCTSPSWCAVKPLEGWTFPSCEEPSHGPSADDDDASQPAESSGGPLSEDGSAKSEVVPATTEPSGRQAEENGAAYSAVADDRTAETKVQTTQLQTTQLQTTQLETTQPQTLELQATEMETAELETTELQTAQLRTTELQTTQMQAAQLQPTELETTELETTQLQMGEPQVGELAEPADNSAAVGRLVGDTAAESQGALDENDVRDLLETSEGNTAVVSGCYPMDTVEPSGCVVQQMERSDAMPEGSDVL
ncbi:hypothetical protein HPB48_006444 [Haemaphysalis longicornis]|uniref:Uncharacterized protein n=1 Tax=Haemaphysalis longicornis TaxID=44386 RepID=A0A9J6FJT9_HAELO|nr:hypothetical protein HPB48_006444 [Haemaphysalis longicornis]